MSVYFFEQIKYIYLYLSVRGAGGPLKVNLLQMWILFIMYEIS
jgi:hypothetical protein